MWAATALVPQHMGNHCSAACPRPITNRGTVGALQPGCRCTWAAVLVLRYVGSNCTSVAAHGQSLLYSTAPSRDQSRDYTGPATGVLLHSGYTWAATALVSTWVATALLHARPVTNRGPMGALLLALVSCSALGLLWCALCGDCVACVWPTSCAASCVGVHCNGSEDTLLAQRVLAHQWMPSIFGSTQPPCWHGATRRGVCDHLLGRVPLVWFARVFVCV